MTALTADRTDSRGKVHGRTQEGVIADGEVIYRGAIVHWNAAGFIVAGSDTAGQIHAGVAIRGGTGNAGGTVVCVFERRGTRWFTKATPVIADLGDLAMCEDDATVELAGTAVNDIVVGKIIDFDATLGQVEVDLEDRVA